jgi:hypothetical protein
VATRLSEHFTQLNCWQLASFFKAMRLNVKATIKGSFDNLETG